MYKRQVLWEDYGHLQESDHFYYMSTKFFSDGEVHSYFNPYNLSLIHISLRVQSDKVTVFPLFPQIPSREKASCAFFVYL